MDIVLDPMMSSIVWDEIPVYRLFPGFLFKSEPGCQNMLRERPLRSGL